MLDLPILPAYCKEPSKETLIAWLESLGIEWEKNKNTRELIKNPSQVKKKCLNPVFAYIWTHFIQCLTAKVGSMDQASFNNTVMVWRAITN